MPILLLFLIVHLLFNFTLWIRITFLKCFCIRIFLKDDVVYHGLSYFSKDVVVGKPGNNTSPDVFGDIVGSTDNPGCTLESDQSICSATHRQFKVGDIYVLDHLKKLVVHFGLMWNFVVSRSGTSLRCNRSTRPG